MLNSIKQILKFLVKWTCTTNHNKHIGTLYIPLGGLSTVLLITACLEFTHKTGLVCKGNAAMHGVIITFCILAITFFFAAGPFIAKALRLLFIIGLFLWFLADEGIFRLTKEECRGHEEEVLVLKWIDVTSEYRKKCNVDVIGPKPVIICVISERPLEGFCVRGVPEERYTKKGGKIYSVISGKAYPVLGYNEKTHLWTVL